jgi:hypothetical protein
MQAPIPDKLAGCARCLLRLGLGHAGWARGFNAQQQVVKAGTTASPAALKR